ncbi:hypothetical protein ACFX10_032000 [Malus domestica]
MSNPRKKCGEKAPCSIEVLKFEAGMVEQILGQLWLLKKPREQVAWRVAHAGVRLGLGLATHWAYAGFGQRRSAQLGLGP